MATSGNSQSSTARTRRSHQKSRNGCLECKRRRIKCDEAKPSCTRCILSLDKCFYASSSRPVAKKQKDELPLPVSSCGFLSPLSSAPPCPTPSPSFGISARSTPEFVERTPCDNGLDDPEGPTDTDLYHHYLQHTSRTLTYCQRDQSALQIGMPTLALQSKTVFHSLLAASAACLGWDMISRKSPPDTSAVNRILVAGYRHHNLASERMRESLSKPGTLKLEPLLASALMLIPFATASQQINHWLSARGTSRNPHKLLSTTPRDVIIIMRGIRTTLQTLDHGSLSLSSELPFDKESAIDGISALSQGNIKPIDLPSSRTHLMFPIVATTSEGALSKLEKRLESAFVYGNNTSDDSLSACYAAFEVLKDLRSNIFSASHRSSSPPISNQANETFEFESAPLPQVASWLRSLARRSVLPLPTESLTRFFLTFLVRSPQAYIDLVLPLLDRRLEDPISTTSDRNKSVELTTEQALALDIYAHWSVFMFLVEDESWWIGSLPTVTLSGMVNAYGDSFVASLWPQGGAGKGQWWPASMLNILREIKRHT